MACHVDYIITVRQQEQQWVIEPNKQAGTRERLQRGKTREREREPCEGIILACMNAFSFTE